MARLSVEGVFDFDGLLRADIVPDSVLRAAADVAVDAQKKTARGMLKGKYATGRLADSISTDRVRRTKDGKSVQVVFKGTRTRGKNKKSTTRNAEIAFVNEFGKRGQPPRPFIQRANEQCKDAAIEVAAKEYDKWLESMGF